MSDTDKKNSELFAQLGQCYRSARAVTIKADEAQKSDRQKLIDASIEQQMLYEKWLKQDQWLLRAQALPLLIGAEPHDWQVFLDADDNRELEAEIWQRVLQGVRDTGTPRVENQQAEAHSWQVKPQDIQYWARTQAIATPSALDMLLSFVSSTVMHEPSEEQMMGAEQFMASNTSSDREMVLGAALALVCTFPDKCRDQHGWVDGYTLATLIEEKGALVFDEKAPVLNTSEKAELLDSWIKKLE